MSNMSYCRYENTSMDLQDCIDNLEEPQYEGEAYKELSDTEKRACDEIRQQCETFIRIYDDKIEDEEE